MNKEIQIGSVSVPGVLWVVAILALMYFAKTYISDSFLVEIIITACFAGLKYFDILPKDVKELIDLVGTLAREVNSIRASSINKRGSSETMRGGETMPVNVTVKINRGMRWLVG